jgi:catechol 2,3-dioxygenase-like lactoylglutathione lyase family enzyme
MRERSGRFASALLSAAVNELCWISLQVPDLERSRAFWRDVIGLPEKSYVPGWVELELRPGLLLALHPVFYPNAMIKRGYDRGGPVLAVRVMNLEEMGALVLRHGARALGGSQEIPGGVSRDFEDPDGYVFELVELRG